MPIGNPQDILTTPYGYSGQVAPETAVNLQNLNRRRLIANMLMQQGMQPQEGQMVGRFYVPAGLARGFAGLGSTLAGALLAGDIDKKSSKAVEDDEQMVKKAIADALASRQGQGEPQPAPMPDQPFTGEVGAVPMPDPGVQSAQPPIPATRPSPQAGIEGMQGLDMANAQPADMSAMVNSANPAMAQAQAATAQTLPQAEPPAPAVQPPPATPPQPGPPSFDAIAQLMTNQHPRARAYGEFLAQMAQREQEREIAARNRQEDIGLKMLQHATPSGSASVMAEAQQATAREAHADRRDAMNRAHEDQQAILQENRRHYASDEAFKKAKLALDERQEKERVKLERERIEATKDVAKIKLDPRTRPMSATAQKELIQTEEELQGSQQAIQNLQNALAINDQAMGFTGAGALASAGSLLPESMRPKAVDATVDLDNLITGSALPQLKAIFGGMPTEGERKVLLEMQGSSSKTPSQRKGIFERAIQAAQNRIKFNTQKAQQLRSGQYFAGDGGLDTTVAPNPGMPAQPSAPQSGGPARITSDAEFDALPSGTTFIGPDGKTRRKP